MSRFILSAFALMLIFLTGTLYGILVHRNHIFPYHIIKQSYNSVSSKEVKTQYGPWSIGIYTGHSPFQLQDPPHIANPVLTGKDVKDIDAEFVADPFLIQNGEHWYLFFEVWNRFTAQGDIGYAESVDGIHWDYKKIIIDEPFHLSYPYVFKWEENFYLIPESHEDLSVRLYRASTFPSEWQYVGNILNGEHYVDPSIFRYDNKWWIFYTSPHNDGLNLYFSDDFRRGWMAHPKNPIVKVNKHIARPGGRVTIYEGNPYRFTQDTDPHYGIQVFAFKITRLSEMDYEEQIVSEEPVITMTGQGWNAYGMHHVDPHFVQGQWIAAVDGRCGTRSNPCTWSPNEQQ